MVKGVCVYDERRWSGGDIEKEKEYEEKRKQIRKKRRRRRRRRMILMKIAMVWLRVMSGLVRTRR